MTPENVVQAVIDLSKGMERPVYRGQADKNWLLQSGALRRITATYGNDILDRPDEIPNLIADYHSDQLIMPMQAIDGKKLEDIQRLSILQHFGAATALLDFTYSPLVALWFSCDQDRKTDGRVFALDIGDPELARNARTLDEPLSYDQAPYVYYEPDHSLSPRIISQDSLLLKINHSPFGNPPLSVEVPEQIKESVLCYLKHLGVTKHTLFSDIQGLATANSSDTRLPNSRPATARQHRRQGNRAYQEGRYPEALRAYTAFAAAAPDIAEPYSRRADTHTALGEYEPAIRDYTRAISKVSRPFYNIANATFDATFTNEILSNLHYNRGNAYAAHGDHQEAVDDYTIAIRFHSRPAHHVLMNRGNSRFALGHFEDAHEDFSQSWNLRPSSDSALARGNCMVKLGKFRYALHAYLEGGTLVTEQTASRCRQNAEEVQRLLSALNGVKYSSHMDGKNIVVATENSTEVPQAFWFSGNRGNTGNYASAFGTAPGGRGFPGLLDFPVEVIPAQP